MRSNCQTDGKSILCFMLGCWSLTGRIPTGDLKRKYRRRILFDNEPSYVVSEIVDSWWYRNPRKTFPHRFVQYMVGWEGYGPGENSWEPFEMIEDTAMRALQRFHERYPSKLRDHRVTDNPNRGTKRRG